MFKYGETLKLLQSQRLISLRRCFSNSKENTSTGADLKKETVINFWIERTKNGELPVYTDYKQSGTRVSTVVRKFRGNVQELMEGLQKVVPGAQVTEKVGRIEVRGSHTQKVKEWLTSLGL